MRTGRSPRLALLLLLGVLGLSGTGAAATATTPAQTMAQRTAAFGAIDELMRSGQKARAADGLVALTEDPAQAVFHAEAFARLGGILEELDLPYGALAAYEKALTRDAVGVSSVAKNAIALADKVGDTALLEPVFAANVGLDVDAATRSRMAYLAARESHHQGNYGTAQAILKMVQKTDPFYPEAAALEGVILSIQGRPKDALIPLLTAESAATQAKKSERMINAVRLNLARAYFAAENFPRAIEAYATVSRESHYWPEASFERAWAHFRINDMNGALGQLQSLQAPIFDDWYFPEADMLRVYGLFLLCKFPDASKGITAFQAQYKPALEVLRSVAARDPATVFGQMRAFSEHRRGAVPTDLPRSLTRIYEQEDRWKDSLAAVQHAEDEQGRLQNVSANPFSAAVSKWVSARHDAIIEAEGWRISGEAKNMADTLDRMLTDSEMSKLDMMQFEQRLYEQAAVKGAIPEARKQVDRKARAKKGKLEWPWEGEYWADELGYYRISTKSECPASLQAGGEGAAPPK